MISSFFSFLSFLSAQDLIYELSKVSGVGLSPRIRSITIGTMPNPEKTAMATKLHM
jgi:hypothetical protein